MRSGVAWSTVARTPCVAERSLSRLGCDRFFRRSGSLDQRLTARHAGRGAGGQRRPDVDTPPTDHPEDEHINWRCTGCNASLDLDEEVVELIDHLFQTVSGSHVETPVFHYAHLIHTSMDKARGYRVVGTGKLRDLRTLRHPPKA